MRIPLHPLDIVSALGYMHTVKTGTNEATNRSNTSQPQNSSCKQQTSLILSKANQFDIVQHVAETKFGQNFNETGTECRSVHTRRFVAATQNKD